MSESHYMELAEVWSKHATCKRASCGTILVLRNQVIGIGWNGSATGEKACIDVGCQLENNHCVRVIHSEVRAVADAARNGRETKGATAFLSQRPCQGCLSILAEAGIIKVFYSRDYHTRAHGEEYCSPDLMKLLQVEQLK